MAFIGEAVLSAFIQTLFDKLASADLLQFARQEEVLADIKKWEKTLLKIHAVLDDAEEKQLTDRLVKLWLADLSDLAYDVEDILDDFATEALGRKLMMAETPQPSSSSKVRRFIPSCCTTFTPTVIRFNVKMRSKIEDITSRLQDIFAQKNDLRLADDIASGRPNRTTEILPSTCLVDESLVYGRETDKAAVLDLLFHEREPSDDAVRVIAIIGMGGVGKTTLAQLAYNDDKVQTHFDLRVWTCVSDDFDVLRVIKTLLQAVSPGVPDVNDLNQLQLKLKEQLSGKKFLLILDDVWNQNCDRWDILYAPMRSGAQGSRVIVTTRNQGVVSAIRAASAYPLKELPNDDCLSLFAQRALGTTNFNNHQHLRFVGEEIVKKCKGLPLAAKALGGMLRSKLNHDAWEDVLKSKIWDLTDQENNIILPALKLSYHHLPSHLKRCFAYCSIFPKDYEFEVEELVLLWMGEGFLSQVERPTKQMEEIGTEFFDELVARSFFQQLNRESPRFVMHDLVHDLAQYVAGAVCFNLEEKMENIQHHTISERVRHSSFIRQYFESASKFEAFGKVKINLRTLVALAVNTKDLKRWCFISQKVLHDLLMGMRCLRVLSLRGYRVSEVPDSIGKLKHLRYLNFSSCAIERLPDSMGELYNLQTLILSECRQLSTLPRGIGKLINLRHLDISDTSMLQEITFPIGNLTNLRTLSRFIVSKSRGSGIDELKKLSNLQGALEISKLHEIVNINDARDANLRDKQKIGELKMRWNDEFCDSRAEELQVLESLQPHKNLEGLEISLYGGSRFPSWIGDPSFSKMVRLTLKDCKRCSLLPSLGGLASLEVLRIEGMEEVKSIGAEFYGEYVEPFASLKELRFEVMPELESWYDSNLTKEKENTRVFPRLEKLEIIKCPKLMGELPKCLPSLVKLQVSECPKLVCGLPQLASLQELNLVECDEAMLRGGEEEVGLLKSLATLNLRTISRLNCLRIGHTRLSLVGLQELVITDCDGLTCLWEEQGEGEGVLLCNLKLLKIQNCAELEKLPDGFHISVMRLEELQVWGCPKLESFPETGLPPMLRSLDVTQCPSLRCLPNGVLPTTLKQLNIRRCENLESVAVPGSLECLDILDCRSLMSFWTATETGTGTGTGTGGELLPSTLKRLFIINCSNLEWMSEKMCPNNSLLEEIMFLDYPNLRSLPPPKCLNSLKMLRIIYAEGLEWFPEGGLPPNLKLLVILGCKNLKSLPNQMRNLTSLTNLHISKCPGLKSLPEGGVPPNLTSLQISSCENLKTPISEWGLQSLTSLSSLTIENMFPAMVSFTEEHHCLLPMSLNFLILNGMKSLTSLPLQNLISLEILEISDCPNFRSLGPIPATLGRLEIRRCAIIKERCLKDKGEYWPIIAHIPCIRIDME